MHASSWLQVVPSLIDMAPNEMQWTIKWWLGLPLTPEEVVYAYCPDMIKLRMHTMHERERERERERENDSHKPHSPLCCSMQSEMYAECIFEFNQTLSR